MRVTVTVNGRECRADVPPMKRLLDVLRQDFGLTGTKEGCGEGECGACTVRLSGRVVTSCLVPVCQADGQAVLTVEGLAHDGRLHPLQECFLLHGGAQCGICTPGMLVAAYDLLERCPSPDREQVRTAIAGNMCRCTGYERILDSVLRGAASARPDGAPPGPSDSP